MHSRSQTPSRGSERDKGGVSGSPPAAASRDSNHRLAQLQQTVGNQAVRQLLKAQAHATAAPAASGAFASVPQMPVIQRMKTAADLSPYPVNWDTLTFDEANALWVGIHSGTLIPEGDEEKRLKTFLKQEDDKDSDYEPGLNEDLQEVVDRLIPHYTQLLEEREGRKLPGRKVQGEFLETFYSYGPIGSENLNEVNANEYLMNMPGIDHIRDHKTHPFVQDKMHLSESTAKPETYREHYNKRFQMSGKFLKNYVSNGTKRRKISDMLSSATEDESWEHKEMIQDLVNVGDSHMKSYKKALEDDHATELPDMSDNDEFIRKVGNAIAFSMPSDMWEKLYEKYENGEIDREEMSAYIRLDPTTQDFRDAFAKLSSFANPMSEKKVKKDDEEYDPTEGDGKKRGRKRKREE